MLQVHIQGISTTLKGNSNNLLGIHIVQFECDDFYRHLESTLSRDFVDFCSIRPTCRQVVSDMRS